MTQTQENVSLRDDIRDFIALFIAMRNKRDEIDRRHGVTIMDTTMEWERKGEPIGHFLIRRGIDQIAEALRREPQIYREWGLQKRLTFHRIKFSQYAETNSTRFLQANEKPNKEEV